MTKPELRVYHPLQVFIIDWLLMLVNQTQVGANLKEYSVILTTSFYDINQKILTKKSYFQSFS